MIELGKLLAQAGHRAGKGTRWFCANCPPGKSAALAVDHDVYFCHRCGVGGNVATLKRELNIFTPKSNTSQERRQLKQELAAARIERRAFQCWLKKQRTLHALWHREELVLCPLIK